MKITITIPEDIYRMMEDTRGLVPRSAYIQDLIRRGSNGFLDELVKEGQIGDVLTKGANPMVDKGMGELVGSGLVSKGVDGLEKRLCRGCGKELFGSQKELCYSCSHK